MSSTHDGSSLPEQLARIDLNLLVAFDALARERSVTRAARRLGVTQSAMSHTLRRLRALLDDPLLVRGRGGMALTPRAESLAIPLRSGLMSLGRALASPEPFAPATARRTFRLASPDLFDLLVVPALLEHIGRVAPGLDVAIVPTGGGRLAERLETGELDLAVMPHMPEYPIGTEVDPAGLRRRTLLRDRFACFLRADHPALAPGRGGRAPGRLSLATYASLSHALVSPSGEGRGPVDWALERRGRTRRIALRVPSFYTALTVVARSDLVLTAPTVLARLAPAGSVAAVGTPRALALGEHGISLVWHERVTADPAHAWLREAIAHVAPAVAKPSASETTST